MSGYCDTVGIDLGTTRSSVAVWDGVQTHVIANESGENTTPSWVTYVAKDKRRVGKAAERAGSKYISSCVYHFKRLIGRPYEDRMQEEAAALNWPFEVVEDKGNAAMRITLEDGEQMILTPEECAAAVLSYLKKVAEDYTGRPVTKAVVTVPAYFSDSQRQATRDAGLIAGLEVRRILNEPTAAALAFGVIEGNVPAPGQEAAGEDGFKTACESPTGEGAAGGDDPSLGGARKAKGKGKNLLVFDFGGGTLDVTIMLISGSAFKVRATDGDMQLGGEDIDALLVQVDIMAMEDQIKRSKALKKLAQGCAMLKVELSRMVESDINVDELVDDFSLESSLKRSDFEEIVAPVLDKIRAPVERALAKVQGGMERSDIDQVLLVGGSSRIPKAQNILQDMFPGTELCRRINPDEAIVVGAAIEASRAVDMTDVVPRPLCIATANHKDRARSFASEIIPASTPIPPEGISVTECFANSRDNQTTVTIRLCEGEGEYFDDNLRLGVFDISDIPPRPRGQVTIKVTMRVDSDGILSVFAVVEQTGQELNVTVTSNKGRMSDEEIEAKRKENVQLQSSS